MHARTLLPLCLVLAIPLPAGAQAPPPDAPVRALDAGSGAVGLRATAEGLLGGGPDYRVELDAASVRFTPALGARAPRTYPLTFALEGIEVGGAALPLAGADPAALDRTVSYDRGGGLTERYELTPDGVEQSFTFAALPAGRGEIVVRGRLTTDLPLVSADERAGLLFARPELGGVAVGGVTGIDANGRRAPGWVRLEGERLELGLPASFVADAALPLVLDPLIESVITVGDADKDDAEVDVTFDEEGGYLLVWTRSFADGDTEIRGRRVAADGTLLGDLILISTTDLNSNPSVGSIDEEHVYVVAWEHQSAGGADSDLQVCTVTASGAVSDPVNLITPFDELEPSVGQGRTRAPLAWRKDGNQLRGASIEVDAFDNPVVASLFAISTDPDDRAPELCDSQGSIDHAFVVWQRNPFGPSSSIQARRWSGEAPLSSEPEFAVRTLLGEEVGSPACAARDDEDYMVVWHETTPLSGGRGVKAARVHYPGANPIVGAPTTVQDDGSQDEHSPRVAYARYEYVVAFLENQGIFTSITLTAIDAMTAEPLEDQQTSSYADSAAIAGRAGTSAGADHVLGAFTAQGDVFATLGNGNGGSQTSLPAAGCAGTGSPKASALFSPSAGHRQELWNAPAGLPALLGIGWSSYSLPLGAAKLLIDPSLSLAVNAGVTDADGYVGTTLPIPAGLAGASLWFQWALVPAGPACTPLGVNLTDGIQGSIE